MSATKVVSAIAVSIIALAVGLSLAMIPLGKPTLWQLIGAPQLVNSEHLISSAGEPDYPWTVHLNNVGVGLLPCSGFDSPQPRAGDIGTFCSKEKDIELKNMATETVLKIDSTSYRFICTPAGPSTSAVQALLVCKVDPWRSLFA